ncbi:MAG: hypothetical protein ABSG53_33850 [Thermoguttaceae bacterium]|jgi:hypothetical protein
MSRNALEESDVRPDFGEALAFRETHQCDRDFGETADILDQLFRKRVPFTQRMSGQKSRS